VVHGAGGYDEAVLHGPVLVAELKEGTTSRYSLAPSDFGLPDGRPEDLAGGSPGENAAALLGLLEGGGPEGLRAAVAANTALVLRAAGACEDLREGAGRAREALASGSAGRHFRAMAATFEEARHAQVS
jgi:anthranilate phosphoribosyltransferase